MYGWVSVNWECAAKISSYMQYPQFVVTQGELCGYGLQCQTIIHAAYISTYFTDCVYRLSEVLYVIICDINHSYTRDTLIIQCSDFIAGCPQILKTDMGTENVTIAVVQPVLRHSGDDSFAGGASHHYGKFTANHVWHIYNAAAEL